MASATRLAASWVTPACCKAEYSSKDILLIQKLL
jgi:hypothetical protein